MTEKEVVQACIAEEENARRRFRAYQIRKAFQKHQEKMLRDMETIPAGIRWSGRISY